MDRLRLPFFVAAILVLLLAILVEVAAARQLAMLGAGALKAPTPGIAISYLALIDGLILYNTVWMVLGIPDALRSIAGRLQGIVTLVLGILALLGTIAVAFAAFQALMLMLSLLVAVPFGTIAYMAAWGRFAVKAAAATLGLAMLLKLAFCVLLVLAHQRFLQNKGLVIVTALSLGLTWGVGFVQAFLPGFLASIGDAAAALAIGIVAAVWLLLLLVGSAVAVVKAAFSLARA